jgi:formate/nitrite transporter FocA (FNT family)
VSAARARPARARRSPRRGILKAVLAAILLGLVFVFGIALGQAIEEAPRPGGTQTLERTLEPDTLPPVTRTITVSTVSP